MSQTGCAVCWSGSGGATTQALPAGSWSYSVLSTYCVPGLYPVVTGQAGSHFTEEETEAQRDSQYARVSSELMEGPPLPLPPQ